jgi:hypothetical protein
LEGIRHPAKEDNVEKPNERGKLRPHFKGYSAEEEREEEEEEDDDDAFL